MELNGLSCPVPTKLMQPQTRTLPTLGKSWSVLLTWCCPTEQFDKVLHMVGKVIPRSLLLMDSKGTMSINMYNAVLKQEDKVNTSVLSYKKLLIFAKT